MYWRQLSFMIREAVTVSDLTQYIKDILEGDSDLQNIVVKGEISNFKHHFSGHMYFTLKDNFSKIKCIMFKGYNQFLKFQPEDGMNMIVTGNISVYERDGQYQLYCSKMEPDGIGSLYLAFEQLKEKLQREGIFDAHRKRELPMFPGKIGVATSPTGSVIRDIINVSTRRFYNTQIVLYPVKVQGDGASETIVEAIEYFNTRPDIGVVIIGRGGGSIEELWPFNEERVARAIYKSKIPVISAVGHETDFTISDFAADVRASTPSQAAEIAVPSLSDLIYKIGSLKTGICNNIRNNISGEKHRVGGLIKELEINSPSNKIAQNMQYLDNLENRLTLYMERNLGDKRNRYNILINKLDDRGPLKILSRGYSYAEKNKAVVKGVGDINPEDKIRLQFKDGSAECKIISITEGDVWQLGKRM
jgi:exodeoxyribonuclease VII large subunit